MQNNKQDDFDFIFDSNKYVLDSRDGEIVLMDKSKEMESLDISVDVFRTIREKNYEEIIECQEKLHEISSPDQLEEYHRLLKKLIKLKDRENMMKNVYEESKVGKEVNELLNKLKSNISKKRKHIKK